jgi:histidinol-phosphate/aromatic aminotransferase/cobyric acid decarboxylase-like protein
MASADPLVPLHLPEIEHTDVMDNIANEYAARNGRRPSEVSHWDASPNFVQSLHLTLPIPKLLDPIPYRYSYDIDRRDVVKKKLGFSADNLGSLITENGSSSIAAVANWIRLSGVNAITVLAPTYFTAPHALRRFGIDVRVITMVRTVTGYRLPPDLGESALWVTNPIYNTGVGLHPDDIQTLEVTLMNGKVVILDEALAFLPSALAARLGHYPGFVSIHTPHKSICANGLKFSIVTFHARHEPAFEHWSDVLSGGLSISAMAAIDYFLSPHFDEYTCRFLSRLDESREWHKNLLVRWSGVLETDSKSQGHFISVYRHAWPATLGIDQNFLRNLVEITGACPISGNRSGFNPDWGFTFRVNLARDDPQFRAAVTRLYAYIAGTMPSGEGGGVTSMR